MSLAEQTEARRPCCSRNDRRPIRQSDTRYLATGSAGAASASDRPNANERAAQNQQGRRFRRVSDLRRATVRGNGGIGEDELLVRVVPIAAATQGILETDIGASRDGCGL